MKKLTLGILALLAPVSALAHIPDECREQVSAVLENVRETLQVNNDLIENAREISEASGEAQNLVIEVNEFLAISTGLLAQEQVTLLSELLECIESTNQTSP